MPTGEPMDGEPTRLGTKHPKHVIDDGSVTLSVGMLCFLLTIVALGGAALTGALTLICVKLKRGKAKPGAVKATALGVKLGEPQTVMPSGDGACRKASLSYGNVTVDVTHTQPPAPPAPSAADIEAACAERATSFDKNKDKHANAF